MPGSVKKTQATKLGNGICTRGSVTGDAIPFVVRQLS